MIPNSSVKNTRKGILTDSNNPQSIHLQLINASFINTTIIAFRILGQKGFFHTIINMAKCTYVVGVETFADRRHQVKLPVLLMEPDRVGHVVRI